MNLKPTLIHTGTVLYYTMDPLFEATRERDLANAAMKRATMRATVDPTEAYQQAYHSSSERCPGCDRMDACRCHEPVAVCPGIFE